MEKKIIIARLQILNGKENEYLSLVSPLIEATRAESGNLIYNIYRDTQDPSAFIVYEEYINDEALNFHCNSKLFQLFLQKVKPFLASEIDIRII